MVNKEIQDMDLFIFVYHFILLFFYYCFLWFSKNVLYIANGLVVTYFLCRANSFAQTQYVHVAQYICVVQYIVYMYMYVCLYIYCIA